jgi:hypothetical protein
MNSASGNIVVVVSGVAFVAEDADVSCLHMGATVLRCTSFAKGSCGPPTRSCHAAVLRISGFYSWAHGLINNIDTKEKCRHPKKLACAGIFKQSYGG